MNRQKAKKKCCFRAGVEFWKKECIFFLSAKNGSIGAVNRILIFYSNKYGQHK